jgi:hypothetical protein
MDASSYFTSDHAGGFRPGEQWEVSRRDHEGTVIVQRHGQEKPLDLDTAQNFEVYAAATTPVAPFPLQNCAGVFSGAALKRMFLDLAVLE